MEDFGKLTQQQLQDILINIVLKGNKIRNLKVSEVIEEIKQQVLMAVNR